jgi:hypothetical protein
MCLQLLFLRYGVGIKLMHLPCFRYSQEISNFFHILDVAPIVLVRSRLGIDTSRSDSRDCLEYVIRPKAAGNYYRNMHALDNFSVQSPAMGDAERRDLKTAEINATEAVPSYIALLKEEREKIEKSARDLGADDKMVRNLLEGLNKRNARFIDFNSRMMQAHAQFYRLVGETLDILIAQFGRYEQYIFSTQAIADSYNAAPHLMSTNIRSGAGCSPEVPANHQRLVGLTLPPFLSNRNWSLAGGNGLRAHCAREIR